VAELYKSFLLLEKSTSTPREVHFYDSSWNKIGTKIELAEAIRRIALIPIDVLMDAGRSVMDSYSVAARFSWSACRNTSRIEDRAYSLLGIFDVHMLMIYGEGRRAFRRLQEEIIKRTNDLTIFAWRNSYTPGKESIGAIEPWLAGGCSALATSPDEFSTLRGLHPIRHSFSEFSVTNRGILLSKDVTIRTMMNYHRGIDIYVLIVGIYGPESQARGGIEGVCLRKIGPRLFQRLSTTSELGPEHSMHSRDLLHFEDVCIIDDSEGNYLMLNTSITEVRHLRAKHRELAIQIQQTSQWTITHARPDGLWDATDHLFLNPMNSWFPGKPVALLCRMQNREIQAPLIVLTVDNGSYDIKTRIFLLDLAMRPRLDRAMLNGTAQTLLYDDVVSLDSEPVFDDSTNHVEHVYPWGRYQTSAIIEKVFLTGADKIQVWSIKLQTEAISETKCS
jgi:hypothetical protein